MPVVAFGPMDREAMAYVQGFGLKAVAPCCGAVCSSRSAKEPEDMTMTDADQNAALARITEITLQLEAVIAALDALYDQIGSRPGS
jgi:hypothetical protein